MTKETVNPLMEHTYAVSEPYLSGYRLVLGFETLEEVQEAHQYIAELTHERHKEAGKCTVAKEKRFYAVVISRELHVYASSVDEATPLSEVNGVCPACYDKKVLPARIQYRDGRPCTIENRPCPVCQP